MRCQLLFLGAVALAGCTAEIPVFDGDDPKQEICAGTVCFAPEHVAVRKWGEAHQTVAAWRGGKACDLPRAGVPAEAIAGQSVVVELHGAKAGARVPVVSKSRRDEQEGPWVTLHALRVDAASGRAWADEEAIAGEATVLDLDSARGFLRIRVLAKWSSGVTSELLLDVSGGPPCVP